MDKDRYHNYGTDNADPSRFDEAMKKYLDVLKPNPSMSGRPVSRDPVFIVREGSPAWDFLMRTEGWQPGAILPASKEEMESFRKDVIIINGVISHDFSDT